MSSRLTKKSFVSVSGFLVKTPCFGLSGIRAENAQAANENRHFRPRQLQQLRAIHQRFLRRHELTLATDVVAEAVGPRFERSKGLHVGLLLRRVHASRSEGDLRINSGVLRRLLDCRTAAQNDQVGKRDLLAELLLDRFELLKDGFELSRLVDVPVLLRG